MENKEIVKFIKEEVEKYIIHKCSIELKENELLLVSVEVGDMPREQVAKYISKLKEGFNSQGITKILIVPKQYGEGSVDITKITEEDRHE